MDTNEEDGSTSLYLFQHKEWLEKEIIPPEYGMEEETKIVFLGCQEPLTPLTQDIRAGRVQIELTSHYSGEQKVYQSHSLNWIDPESQTAELVLYQKTEE
jgi:hypothetical protein